MHGYGGSYTISYGKGSTGNRLDKMKRLFSSRKATFQYWSDWAELFFIILLLVGIVMGVMSPNYFITYAVSFVAGMIAGRLIYDRKDKGKAPYLLIIIGFILGFVVGTFHGNRTITFLLFLFGAALTYYLFDKKIIKDTFI